MPRTSLSRRLGGFTLAGALALTTVALTAAPASAAGYDGQSQAATAYSAAGSCNVSNAGTTAAATPITSNGVPVTASLSDSSVVTDPGDAADITNLTASVTGRAVATEAAGVLKTFDIESTMSASVNPVQGAATDCDASAGAQWSTTGTLTLPSRSVLVLTGKARGGIVQFVVQKATPPQAAVATVNIGTNGKERRVLVLPAGTYQMISLMGNQLAAPAAAGDPTTSSAKIEMHGVVSALGSASAPTAGKGQKYLKLPDTLNCAAHSVVADFTKAAGRKATKSNGLEPKIRRAKFLVNDDKVKTVQKPHKKTLVTLAGLDDTDEVTVEAVLTLKDRSKVTVSRSYLPCS